MKKLSFKITKGLKFGLLVGSMLLSAWAGSTKTAATLAFVPFALVTGMKKKGFQISDDEAKVLNGLEAELNEHMKAQFDEYKKGLLSEEEFKTKRDELLKDFSVKAGSVKVGEGDAAKSIEEVLRTQGEEITALKAGLEGNSHKVAKSIASALVEGFKQMAKDGKLEALKKGQWETIEVKAAATMSTGNLDAVGENSIAFTNAQIEPGLARFVRRNPFIAQIMNQGRTRKGYVQWVEMANPDGGAGMTAEGAAKSQADFDLVEKSAKVRKITAYIKVSKEMLDDIDFIEAEIRNELVSLIQLKLDEQLLSGDGTGENLKGVLAYATAFAAGNFAGQVANANRYDVLRCAIQQVASANFDANYIVLNPEDVALMDLEKGVDGHYVMPPFITASGNTIKGIPIVANNGVTSGDFLVGDFTKANLRIREDIALSTGLENDDFTKNLLTILGEMRAVHYIKSQHTAAFVTGDFETAIGAITTP